jgi:aminoglycoside phosphotransferase (APT) family kinase protein
VELFLDADLRRQGQILDALNTHSDIPVPGFVGVEMNASLIGEPFLVMALVEGQVIGQNPNYNESGWLADLPPQQRAIRWHSAIEAFAQLHQLNWQQGFEFLNRPERGNNGFDQFFYWFSEWHDWTASGREQMIADSAMAYLKANKPDMLRTCVLWGDPHQSNVIFNHDGSVAALIDWELVSLGTPEIDLAFWLYFDEMWGPMSGQQRLPGLPNRQEVIAIYEKAANYRVQHLEYFEVLAGLRFVNIIRKCVDRLIAAGMMKPDTKAGTHNMWTQHLARLLGMEQPELDPDFFEFLKLM